MELLVYNVKLLVLHVTLFTSVQCKESVGLVAKKGSRFQPKSIQDIYKKYQIRAFNKTDTKMQFVHQPHWNGVKGQFDDEPKYVFQRGNHIAWDQSDFAFSFGTRGISGLKIRRAPKGSVGHPWPLPQTYNVNRTKLYVINANKFSFVLPNISCSILELAVTRYKNIIFKFATQTTIDNLHHVKSMKFTKFVIPEDVYSSANEIGSLLIRIKSPCASKSFPSENSNESYSLVAKSFGALLVAEEVWGALRGLETFSQLVFKHDEKFYIRDVSIKDFPRFQHRGILIDSSRHFMKKSTIKDVLEGMVQNKMNVLHWHLVDDQSFPYYSRTYPELSEKGAYHTSLQYKPQDIAEIIDYARLRGIRVIPELDTPGHTYAWGFSHPELLTQCYSGQDPVPGYLGPMDPSKNTTFTFLKNIFRDLLTDFPDRYLHVGGDEVPMECWLSNKEVRALLSRLSSNHSIVYGEPMKLVWNYFIDGLAQALKEAAENSSRDYRLVMWEEALKFGLDIPDDTIIQIWFGGINEVQRAVENGYNVIYSTCWYLDWVGHGVHWPKYYLCDPNPATLGFHSIEKGILGGEACIWSEYITDENAISLLWPRASAVAERLWSNRNVKDVNAAAVRLQEHRCRMIRRGLKVGHINGPDYCLLPDEADVASQEPEVYIENDVDTIDILRLRTVFKPNNFRLCNAKELEIASLAFSLIALILVLIFFGLKMKYVLLRLL